MDNESGEVTELRLRTLAKNSASKLPEIRKDFAWFVSVSDDSNVSFFMHGGCVENAKTKKKKFLNDFYHLDVSDGLFRKFFLFDAAKARSNHAMARLGNEVFLYGGQGLNNSVYDDIWRFDLENVQWSEQK